MFLRINIPNPHNYRLRDVAGIDGHNFVILLYNSIQMHDKIARDIRWNVNNCRYVTVERCEIPMFQYEISKKSMQDEYFAENSKEILTALKNFKNRQL